MNSIREILQINAEELRLGLAGTKASWHEKYAQSAWVYVGNLDVALTEGDVLAVLSQWGELDDVHLVRDEATGQSRGFAFCRYSDARSCVLAVDNLCGVTVCGRSLRVDHVENYRLPQHLLKQQEEAAGGEAAANDKKSLTEAGHAYQGKELASEFTLQKGQDLFSTDHPADAQAAAAKGTKRKSNDDDKKGENSREAKKQRKEERRRQRAAKKERHREREERRRERRARKLAAQSTDANHVADEGERRRRKHSKKKRKHHHKKETKEEEASTTSNADAAS